jgi:hypothetical protein
MGQRGVKAKWRTGLGCPPEELSDIDGGEYNARLQYEASEAVAQALVVVASVGCHMAFGVLLRLPDPHLCS